MLAYQSTPEPSSDIDQRLGSFDALRVARNRQRYDRSLLAFVRDAWHVLEPEHPFVENWHIVVLCEVLEQMAAGKIKREIINVPPGTMKSLLVSVIFPCWLWAKNPRLRILTAAYSDKRALDANIKARNLLKSEWFQKHYPRLKLVEDQNTKGRFDTTKGGWRIATSVGGEGTGLHPDLIIIDDASTASDALSDVARKVVNDWFDQTISTRGVSRDVSIIVIGQRLHTEDLPGHLLARGGWDHVCWPMRYIARRPKTDQDPGYEPDPRDPRTIPGELLFPQLFDEKKVAQLEKDLLAYGTAGQLQQQPVPEGGGQFERGWFKFIDVAPTDLVRIVRGWDTAGTEGAGDFTRGVKIGERKDGSFVVLDMVGGQLNPAGVDALMLSTANSDGKHVAQREEREGGASGKAVVMARAKMLKGFDYAEVQIGGSKQTRVKPFRSQCGAGNVYVVRARWNEEYISELCDFPNGKHDDCVDGSSCSFNALLLEPRRSVMGAVW